MRTQVTIRMIWRTLQVYVVRCWNISTFLQKPRDLTHKLVKNASHWWWWKQGIKNDKSNINIWRQCHFFFFFFSEDETSYVETKWPRKSCFRKKVMSKPQVKSIGKETSTSFTSYPSCEMGCHGRPGIWRHRCLKRTMHNILRQCLEVQKQIF